MADKKISALTGATTPLAGSEVLPIVQGGATVKVSIDNITAGKAVSAASLNVTSNDVTLLNNKAVKGFLQDNSAAYNLIARGTDNRIVIDSDGFGVWMGYNNAFGIKNDNLTMAYGNFIVGAAGKGIDFSANGGDVLSQYDEGSWTPTITASSGAITSYTSSARYTRVGRLVTAVITFKITDVGTASGAVIASLSLSTDAAITYIGSGRDDNTGNMVQGRVVPALPSAVYFATYANASIAATNTEVFFTIQYFV